MKKVFNNSDLVHTFNQQDQIEGRTQNNGMFFYKTKLYSYGYHYLLCEFIDQNTVIINNDGYSVSTSKHIGMITLATQDRKQYFTQQIETKAALSNVKNWLDKVVRARSTNSINYYVDSINSTFKAYFDYLEYTKQKTKYKKYANHREIVRISESFYNDFENLETRLKEAQIKQAAKNKKETEKKVKNWKKNELDWFRSSTGLDYLRLKGENVETSQGVKVPIKEVKRLLNILDRGDIVGERVNDTYIVRSFNGLLKIGCHNIPKGEINYIKSIIS